MVLRRVIECSVCKCKIIVRGQVGFLPEHPIMIYCAECKILISGTFYTNQEEVTASMSFDNAKDITDQTINGKYCIEVSGELLTKKIKLFEKTDIVDFSPFMRTMQNVDFEIYNNLKQNFIIFIEVIKAEWLTVRQINELWLNQKYDYLQKELSKRLTDIHFSFASKKELLKGVHMITLNCLSCVLPKDYINNTAKPILKKFFEIANLNITGLISLAQFFDERGFINNHKKDVFKIYCSFVDKYKFFVPAFILKSYKVSPNYDLYGTATVSFDDIKQIYLDCFEFIGEAFPLISALNNLMYRDDFNTMATMSEDKTLATTTTLEKQIKQSKGNRLKFGASNEFFNEIIQLATSAELRNVIGHIEAYDYDGATQTINYWPSCFRGKGVQKSIYLVEFIQNTLGLFETVIIINEIIFQIQKILYDINDNRHVSDALFCDDIHYMVSNPSKEGSKQNTVKQGRNILCKCGSGNKYKRCCGS